MDKFRKFCKKPLLIISSVMIGVFALALLVMLCIPKGKTYVYRYEKDKVQYTYTIELGKKFVETHTYTDENGNVVNVKSARTQEYDYKVDNKELFLVDTATEEKVKIGDITARKLILDYNLEEDIENPVLYCSVNRVLSNVFIVCLYFGIFLLAICIVVNYIHKKQDLQNEKAENIAEVQREQEAEQETEKQAQSAE